MRITWYSNAPWSPTGYGTQTAQVVRRLHAAGHEVAVASNYSPLVPELWDWPVGEIPVYPQGRDLYSNDILRSHHEHWTRGSHKSWLITLYDVHVLAAMDDVRIASWVPIDHAPVPPKVWAWFQGSGVLPLAMSRFGQEELRRKDIDARYVPHAIERVFQPTPRLADGRPTRAALGIPDDAFVVMINAANQGNIPPRKAWDQMYRGLSVFMREHEDAVLFLVTDLLNPGGVDLIVLAAALGLPAERVKRVDQYAYRCGWVTQETLAAYYTMADVLLATSMGEGFGLPVIEAQACFPGDTPVGADDAELGMVSRFSGSLVEIETAIGMVTATPDHPFWTDNGWRRAVDLIVGSRLLHNPDYAEARTVTGRIDDVGRAVSGHAADASGGEDGAVVLVGAVGEAPTGTPQVVRSDRQRQAGDSVGARARLSGRADRRGGHGLDPEVQRKVEAAHPYREYFARAARLAGDDGRGAGDLHGASTHRTEPTSVLHVSHPRDWLRRALRTAIALHGHQARTDVVDRGVLPHTAWAGSDGSAERAAVVAGLARTGAEYQTVTAIRRREVVDLPVYNLKTRSGTYSAAGFLVHNCGTPVIVSDFSAQPELVGAGWTVPIMPWFDLGQAADMALPMPNWIARRLEEAHEARGDMGLAGQAIAKAAEYDADRVFAEHWTPVLEEMERKLAPPSVQRRLARVK